MPFVSQAAAVKSRIQNHQKSHENEVKPYLKCNICENVVLFTQENFKKHYNEIHQRNPPIQKNPQEGELCTIL